jgi:hypothetical protein
VLVSCWNPPTAMTAMLSPMCVAAGEVSRNRPA